MTGKIFRNSLVVGILILALCAVLFSVALYQDFEEQVFDELALEAEYISHGLELSGEAYLQTLQADTRITWVDADGTVLYDSAAEAASMENHLNRAEIADALVNGYGRNDHYSQTLTQRTLYYAVRMGDGTVLRVACTQSTVAAMLLRLLPTIGWIVLLALALCGLLSFRLARQITAPINTIDLDCPRLTGHYKELAPLIGRLQEQNKTIRRQMEELSHKQREFTAMADNMQEGFLLLDLKMNILSCNKSALEHLHGQCGQNMVLTRTEQTAPIYDAAVAALAGKRCDLQTQMAEQVYQIIASPVSADGQVSGAVVLLVDVTERAQREALRREFSANVSHELKTPLTSISGFAELMQAGLVPPEKIPEFSGDILREAHRLLTLVEDIIKLSRLDENPQGLEWETVDLYELSEEVLTSLRPVAEKQNIQLKLTGQRVLITGVWQILNEMIYNLCDNAIKYNRPGGSVTVTVQEGFVQVADTGIGIPYAHQSRVFERFYRVDKSHSKAIGGTGLGLSIVKHGAIYHGARVELESEPDVGTTVTIRFPQTHGQATAAASD